MKFFILNLLLCLPVFIFPQVYSGTGGAILSNGQESSFSNQVSSLPNMIDSLFGLEEICFTINHPAVEELHVTLRSPSGVEVELTGMKSCKGSNYNFTCLNNQQSLSISTGAAPYSGSFRPLGNIGRVNNNSAGNGAWQLLVKDFTINGNNGTVNSWQLKFGNNPAQAVMIKSSNLPLVFINTNSFQALSENQQLIDLGIIYGTSRNYITDLQNNYKGKAMCNIRGASSRIFEKKNLKIELKKSDGLSDTLATLVDLPAESDWILTACYTDKTLMRNPLSHYIFQGMGHYSPRYRYVELILNGEYFGVYILSEQIKQGAGRVKIPSLANTDNQFPEITGGYIVQIDRADDPGWYSLFPGVSANSAKFYIQYNYPKASVITEPQKNYLKAVVDSFETVMASGAFNDPAKGYSRFIDAASFVDYLILSEFSKNVDAYKLSSYLYKKNISEGGKIFAGPAWDYDLSWHNANFGNAFSEEQWQHVHNNSSNPIPTWWRRLMEDPAFQDQLKCRYEELRNNLLNENTLYKFIDETAAMLTESRERNFRQFPIIGAYVWPNPQAQQAATYETELTDLKNWIHKRSDWLDTNVPGLCGPLATADPSETTKFLLYPNPFTDKLFIKTVDEGSLDFEISDLSGRIVMKDRFQTKTGSFEISTSGLGPGTYILKASTSGETGFQKIIKYSE